MSFFEEVTKSTKSQIPIMKDICCMRNLWKMVFRPFQGIRRHLSKLHFVLPARFIILVYASSSPAMWPWYQTELIVANRYIDVFFKSYYYGHVLLWVMYAYFCSGLALPQLNWDKYPVNAVNWYQFTGNVSSGYLLCMMETKNLFPIFMKSLQKWCYQKKITQLNLMSLLVKQPNIMHDQINQFEMKRAGRYTVSPLKPCMKFIGIVSIPHSSWV